MGVGFLRRLHNLCGDHSKATVSGVARGGAFHRGKRFCKLKGFIVKDNPDWKIDSSISLDFADSLDDISDFKEELKSADSNFVGEISNSSAPIDDSNVSDNSEGTSATEKNGKRKKPTAKNKQRNAEEMIVALSNQNSQHSPFTVILSQALPQCSDATSMGNCQNKNTYKKANCCGNQNWKTTKMLTKKTNKEDLGDVMMKLERKRLVFEILYQSSCLNSTS